MKVQNNLENIIFNGEMGFFGFGKKKGIKEHTENYFDARNGVDKSRRNFLTNAAKGIARLYLAQGISGVINYLMKENPKLTKEEAIRISNQFIENMGPTKAEAYNIPFKALPPGVRDCRDPAIKLAYALYKFDYNTFFYDVNTEGGNIALGILRMTDVHYGTYPLIKKNTPLIEPAYWYLTCIIGKNPENYKQIEKRLEKENPSLNYFQKGLSTFFFKYIKGYQPQHDRIEKNLLSSIITAANRDVNEVDKYLQMNINQRENYMKNIMKTFKSYDFDEKLNQINDNYDKLLTAQWASFWLANHYYYLEKKGPNTMNIYNNLEEPGVFKNKKKNKKIDLRIRGPPYYY